METCPTLIRTEVRATIVTVGIGRIVAVVVAISPTGEERSHGTAAKTCTNLWRTCSQCRIMYLIRRQSCIIDRGIVVLRLPALLSKHGGSRVLAKGTAVGQVVLQLPELAAVLLDAALVAGTLPSTEVNHRFISLCTVPTEVKAQLGVPYQILNRSHLEVHITIQFLTLQQDVVHHCHGNGVRVRITFLRNGRVSTIYIINRYRGNCCQ